MSMIDKLRAVNVPRVEERPFGAPRPKVAQQSPEELRSLKALSDALAEATKAIPDNPLAQGFVDAGETIAQAYEKLGDTSLATGERRKKEYYHAAMVIRDKCRYQAAEALDFANQLGKIRDFAPPSAANFVKDILPKHITPQETHDAKQAEERTDDDPHDGPAEP